MDFKFLMLNKKIIWLVGLVVLLAIALITSSFLLKKDEIEQQIIDPNLVYEERSDIDTDIKEFKLLGFTLGQKYDGKIIDGIDKNSWGASILRPDIFNEAIFIRTKAPSNMGELDLLVSPKTKTILAMALTNHNFNENTLKNLLANIFKNCKEINSNKLAGDMIKKDDFTIDSEYKQCDIKIDGESGYYNGRLLTMRIGMGPESEFRSGHYQLKSYRPKTLILKIDRNLLKVAFSNSYLEQDFLGTQEADYHSAFFNLTGKEIKELLEEENKELAENGNDLALLNIAIKEKDFDNKINLLKQIEDKNQEAKLLLADTFVKQADKLTLAANLRDDYYSQAFDRVKELSDQGNLKAKGILADLYRFGKGVATDKKMAAKLLKESGDHSELYNFCNSTDQNLLLPECSEIKAQNEEEVRQARIKEEANRKKLSDLDPKQVAKMNVSRFAQCFAGQIIMSALIARGDKIDSKFAEKNKQLGRLLTKASPFIKDTLSDPNGLDRLFNSWASTIRTGDDAARIVVECIEELELQKY